MPAHLLRRPRAPVGAPASRARSAGRRLVLLAVAALTTLLLGPLPARAHGSVEVPTARITAVGSEVNVTWSAAEDDAAAIAVGLGLAAEEAVLDHLAGLAALPDDADPRPLVDALLARIDTDRLTGAPELDAYLLAAIQVAQDGRACPGTVGPTDAFLTAGAELVFRCPAPVETIDLTITVLHEQDPTHRTFSSDGSGEVAMHTLSTPTSRWSLGDDRAGTGSALAVLGVGLALAGFVGVGGLALLTRPGTVAPSPTVERHGSSEGAPDVAVAP
jgi:hypothetical protein